jgi:hypothetical protein
VTVHAEICTFVAIGGGGGVGRGRRGGIGRACPGGTAGQDGGWLVGAGQPGDTGEDEKEM